MLKVYLLGNAQRAGVAEEVERALPFLREHADVLLVDLLQEADLAQLPRADVALVFGGDGAILRAARQMGYRQIPVLGVNLGRLGFLADIHPQELPGAFLQVVAGHSRVTHHLMYECVLHEPGGGSQTYLGLNEVVIHTGPPFHLIELEMEVDGDAIARFRGDGLIVSTPIGSTAHSLSAGGPILAQELDAFVVTPICPHTLTYRPLVESADKRLLIRLGSAENALVVIDGQTPIALTVGHLVEVRRAPIAFALVKVPQRSFYQTLRDKLHWGAPPRYRGEP